jgi:hypothetical protein
MILVYCHVLEGLSAGFGLDIGFIDHLRIVTISNSNSLRELPTPNITLTTAHINCSLSLLDVAW